jgi:Na+/proline symporter
MSEPEDPHPPKNQFLDYRGIPDAGFDKPRMTGGQIAMGFACWVASVAVAYALGVPSRSVWIGFLGFAAVLISSTVYFSNRLRWRGFLPGIFIGAAMTCLVPLGILAVFCSTR